MWNVETGGGMRHHIRFPFAARNRAIIVPIAIICILFNACDGNMQPHITIGILAEVKFHERTIEGFKEAMADFGYVEGENVTYIYNGLTGNSPAAVDDEVKALLARKTDMLFTTSNLTTLRAKAALDGTRTPIVFGSVSNPVRAGIVESISHPGGTVTGIQVGLEVPKALEWLTKIVPEVGKVFVPYNPDDPVSVMFLDKIDAAARQLKIEIDYGVVHSAEDAVAAIEALPSDIQAIFSIPSPTLDPESSLLSQAAIDRRLPLIAGHPLDEAVLLTLTSDPDRAGRRAARLAHQILQGMKPADLPVETNEIQLIINLKTAARIGLKIPDDVLHQASRIIR